MSIKMLLDPVTLGVALGLFAGKQIGVFGAVVAAVKLGWAQRPAHAGWWHLYGLSLLCGVGFTMSLFIGLLAFADSPELEAETKIGVLLGSLSCMALGALVLLLAPKLDRSSRPNPGQDRGNGMNSRLRAWLETLGDQFWLRPAVIVLACLGLGQLGVWLETARIAGYDASSPAANWGYSGGAEGARALLSAVASSTIGVAGTTFSITIAALSMASGQMGPRLLRNFTRDARNQVALGIFLGTFAYALIVLRTVRTVQETPFVPHLAVTGAILLAMLSVATLVWFVHHIAAGINVETVVNAVHDDLCDAIERHSLEAADVRSGLPIPEAGTIAAPTSGYLQAVDRDSLADWAHEHGVLVSLRVRPGDYVPAGFQVAHLSSPVEDAPKRSEGPHVRPSSGRPAGP